MYGCTFLFGESVGEEVVGVNYVGANSAEMTGCSEMIDSVGTNFDIGGVPKRDDFWGNEIVP